MSGEALKTAKAIWDALPDQAKEDLVMSLLDSLRGKPPRAVRLSRLKAETLMDLAEVRARFR